MNEFGKYRLFRKYVSEDGVNYTPLDEYQALLVENDSCQCGYREFEYRFDGEYKNETFKKYEIWNEYSFCPTDSSYDELTGNVDYRNPTTADGVIIATYRGNGASSVRLCNSYFYEKIAINNVVKGGKYTSYIFKNTSLNDVAFLNVINTTLDGVFKNCPRLISVNIGSGVTSIGTSAFTSSTSLGYVKIPDSVTSIGDYAFSACTSLSSVELGNGVISIGNYALSKCYPLKSIKIPSSVTSIGDYAFEYCTSLNSITCYATTKPSLGTYVFDGLPKNGKLHVPSGSDYSSWLTQLPSGWTIEYI